MFIVDVIPDKDHLSVNGFTFHRTYQLTKHM